MARQQLTAIPVDAGKTQGREAQGEPARHRRCRALSGDRAHRRRRCAAPTPRSRSTSPASPSCRSPAAKACSARAPPPARRARFRSWSPIPAPRRPRTSSCRATRRTAGRSRFEPKTIDRIAPNEHKEVQALISPPGKAIAGDYVTTLHRRHARRNRHGEFPRHRDDLDRCGASPASASSAPRC